LTPSALYVSPDITVADEDLVEFDAGVYTLVFANDVTIDLNGYSIIGVTPCAGFPPVCSPTGTGAGIDGFTFSVQNTTVRNGTVRGMGYRGVAIRDYATANIAWLPRSTRTRLEPSRVRQSRLEARSATGI
jgi:hypothetical protein